MKRDRRTIRPAALAVSVAVLGVTALSVTAAFASPPPDPAATSVVHDPATVHGDHDLEGPFSEKQAAQRQVALEQVISGEASAQQRGTSKVVKLGKNKYVELAREKTDKIFTILVEFGDTVDDTTTYDPDGAGPQEPVVKYGGDAGPLHNEIAEPDPAVDNTTLWKEDFDRQSYQELYFAEDKDSLKTYYEKQSSGRYSVDGEVADWVEVPYNEARYGSNYCGQSTCSSVWDLVRDGVNQWVDGQETAGATDAEIKERLAEYDLWDRYDHDGDGDFNESDGYIDHFQIVHAGEDESAGGGAQGDDAIWAHRWYAYSTNAGNSGPGGNKAGGAQIGDTGVWVGDYTIQPENGGLGVFAHEYGHDLGLPDLYDTSGAGESSVAYWSLMSSGSWLGEGKDSIGDMPGDMTAWDKLQLGWLDYDSAAAATNSIHKLGVAEYNTKNAQALVVNLPAKEVTTPVVKPAEGEKQWWSGSGDDLSNTLTRSVDLTGKTAASLSLQGWWDVEAEYDYLYTEASTDGGTSWQQLDGTADGSVIGRDSGGKPAISGVSGTHQHLVFPLDAYAGQKTDLRFRYLTDGGVALKGFAADAITITADGTALFSDDAEGGDNGWTAKGFSRMGESFTNDYAQYYIAENRQYVSYDRTLKTGPYNFGYADTRPDWVEHFPYQNGLLVWLWDTSEADNNVGQHPGSGLILPVDAHAVPETWSDGTLMRNRIQAYDSPFSTRRTDGITLHRAGVATKIAAKRGASVFDDRRGTYWYDSNPTGGVRVPDTNTRISILSEKRDGSTMVLRVGPSQR